ncbi:glycoside hydrolase family 15 protein [Streptomyces coelicoflavus]|uniref:glycoside hydrolase family 15 protein n=1 Tax=Streptomyces coelicoflavus TaxID=285562 RepID=UPI0024AD3226|nr:glycoside hydrolase family 15 protein [Streptomyces coelicoflavus]MDI6515085.1 glycoside hydrolase family 15 protein [Streptomyces coelicoflavus]
MSRLIEDYALLSDLETAALVGRDGSVDWLCLPRFDSPACLAALLGTRDHGFWRIAPRGAVGPCARRAYRAGTLVLDTEWRTGSGTVRVSDFMPPHAPNPCVVRVVEGVSGAVTVRSEFRPRFHQGRVVPWTREADGCDVAVAGPDAVWLGADGPAARRVTAAATVADFTVAAGTRLAFTMAWAPSHRATPPTALAVPAETFQKETVDFWRRWAARCRYQGPWRDAVVRSLITLKALTYAPTGGIVAAPTTSLPGRIGGPLNYDHRYCWLRDSTLTLSCLLRSGYQEEAAAWLGWLVRAVAGDPARIQAVYGVAGQRLLPETEAPWLPGYEGSRPVRFGNAAMGQRQLDVYGEVLDTLWLSLRAGIDVPPHVWSLAKSLMEYLQDHWREPDQGLWQERGPARQFVHSKVMTWVAADRVLRLGALLGADVPAFWYSLRDEVRRQVCRRGWDSRRRSFVRAYGSSRLDASALLMPALGFLPAADERVRDTVRAMAALEHGGYLRPYEEEEQDGGRDERRGPGRAAQAPSVACSLWYAGALGSAGQTDRARAQFERVLAHRNDVGLLSERWDPDDGRQLGNAPQAFSHLALVQTAYALTEGPRSPR